MDELFNYLLQPFDQTAIRFKFLSPGWSFEKIHLTHSIISSSKIKISAFGRSLTLFNKRGRILVTRLLYQLVNARIGDIQSFQGTLFAYSSTFRSTPRMYQSSSAVCSRNMTNSNVTSAGDSLFCLIAAFWSMSNRLITADTRPFWELNIWSKSHNRSFEKRTYIVFSERKNVMTQFEKFLSLLFLNGMRVVRAFFCTIEDLSCFSITNVQWFEKYGTSEPVFESRISPFASNVLSLSGRIVFFE